MRNVLHIVFFVSLSLASAPARAVSPSVDGLALGMLRLEAVAALRSLGFTEFIDADHSTMNGKTVTLEDIDKRLSKPVGRPPCVMRTTSGGPQTGSITCELETTPMEKRKRIELTFLEGRVSRLVIIYQTAKAKTMLADLQKKFGAITLDGDATPYLEIAATSLEKAGCQDSGCRVAGWRRKRGNRQFLITAIYRRMDPDTGRAIALHFAWDDVVAVQPRTARRERGERRRK